MSNKRLIKVKVEDAEEIIFEGEVDKISSFNEEGQFDVYPMHANFISIIQKELSFYNNHQKVKDVQVEKAVMKVKKDIVSIFLGIETLIIEEENSEKKDEKKP